MARSSPLYAQAARATGDHFFSDIAGGIASWVLREMQAPEGGYYSSLDADSEGHEGRFYVWDRKEIQDLLDRDEYRILARRFGLDEAPNFEGHWHLHARESLEKIASREQRERVRDRIDPRQARARSCAARASVACARAGTKRS